MKKLIFLTLLAPLCLSPRAWGATVKAVKKKTVEVELGDGESFDKGSSVCFYDDDGGKTECGTVSKVKNGKVLVKVKRPKKVKSGQTMKAADEAGAGSGSASASGSADDEASGSDDAGDKKAKKKDKEAQAGGKKNPLRLVGYYNLPLRTPAQYNKISYSAPQTTAPTTLWSADQPVNSASLGLGFELAIPVGGIAIIPGARYRSFTPSVIDSDYTSQKLNPYISTEEKATAIGVYADVQYLRLNLGSVVAVNLLAGLDLDMSTVTVKATKKDDSPGGVSSDAGSATSKLDVASLRLGFNTDIMTFKVLGGRLGLSALLPLAAFGAKFSGTVAEDRGVPDTSTDLKTAIGHKKASLGLEIDVGGVLAP